MDGWAPLGQVKQEQKRRSDILDSSAEGASSADAEAAVTVGHGRVRQLTTSNLSMNSTSGPPTNLQRGLSVTADPVTGGLVGLPESWAGLLPQGLSGTPRSAESVPETLRVATVPEEGLKLSDTVIVGRPYNVTRWKPSFGMPLEACELIRINGFDIPRVLEEVASCLLPPASCLLPYAPHRPLLPVHLTTPLSLPTPVHPCPCAPLCAPLRPSAPLCTPHAPSCTLCPPAPAPHPLLLLSWRQVASCLRDRGGLREEGIFRIAPNAADCEPVKEVPNMFVLEPQP